MEHGKVGIDWETKGNFRLTGANREYVCDKCGYKALSASLNEYVPVSDSVIQEKKKIQKMNKIVYCGWCSK
jgi:hypothetical protein